MNLTLAIALLCANYTLYHLELKVKCQRDLANCYLSSSMNSDDADIRMMKCVLRMDEEKK